jgi:hypothetical protein
MKVTSFWYKKGDGVDFHIKDKNELLMGVVFGHKTFNDLKYLIIKREWLTSENETLLPSEVLATNMHNEYVRRLPIIMKGCGWINKMAASKGAGLLLALYKSDSMYSERMGYLMHRFIELYPLWCGETHEVHCNLLHAERLNYFVHEKRQDRLIQLNRGWDYLEKMYREDAGITRSLDWLVEYLYEHRSEFNYDEVSRLGHISFHPENWYPVGRGQLWDMVNAGNG